MADDITEAFRARVADWPAKLAADEWFFASVREELVAPLSPEVAFGATGGAASLVLRLREPALKAEAAELLLALARRSGTTEVCEPLAREWGRVMAHLGSLGPAGEVLAGELALWYRRAVSPI